MKGQKRLDEIKKRLEAGIRNVNPENPERYAIRCEPLIREEIPTEREVAGIALTQEELKAKAGRAAQRKYVLERSPQYQFLVVDKENPDATYRVMTTHWADIKKPTPDYMERYMGGVEFEPNIREAINTLRKGRGQGQGGLERTTEGVISIVGVLGGLFFLSSNITGNTIADLTAKNTGFIGAGLLFIGFIAGFFWLKAKKK